MLRSEKRTFLNMSNTCLGLDYMPESFDETLDYIDLDGTNCYLDNISANRIRADLEKRDYQGIHYIDNGNYHYLSLLYLELIQEDFNLLVYDNHPDMQLPAFGDIISCGGWLKMACHKIDHLKKVYLIGVEDQLIRDIEPLDDKIEYLASHKDGQWIQQPIIVESDLPLAISVDLDVLRSDDFKCDWSQGIMTRDQLESDLDEIVRNNDIVMVDICG